MGNIKLFEYMSFTTVGMIVIALIVFIYAYLQVKHGSGLKDVA